MGEVGGGHGVGGIADCPGEVDARLLALLEGLEAGVAGAHGRGQGGVAAGRGRLLGEEVEVHAALAAVGVEAARGQFAELAEAAHQGDACHRVVAQVLEHSADEIAHLHQRHVGQAVLLHGRAFAGGTGAGGDVRDTVGARDIDPLVDRGDEGGAGERAHDAGRAQDRDAALDAEAGVHGVARNRLAVVDADGDVESAGPLVALGGGCQMLLQDLARLGVDGGLAHRQRQARPSDGADTRARGVAHTRRGPAAHLHPDPRAVGGIRVVAGIFDDAGLGGIVDAAVVGDGEVGGATAGQVQLHRSRASVGEQKLDGRAGGRGRAGAGGPAGAQRPLALGAFLTHGRRLSPGGAMRSPRARVPCSPPKRWARSPRYRYQPPRAAPRLRR